MYYKRLIDDKINELSSYVNVIYLRGAKWVGKTTTCANRAKTIYRLLSKHDLNNLKFYYDIDPTLIFRERKPILFDEWQQFPELWNECKIYADSSLNKGEIFLTGSRELTKEEKKLYISHSGLGRISQIIMRPMSLYESLESNGAISLGDLFEADIRIKNVNSPINYENLVHLTIRGGFPASLGIKFDGKEGLIAKEIVENIILNFDEEDDEESSSKGPYQSDYMRIIIKELARNSATMANYTKMLTNIVGEDNRDISTSTFLRYRNILKKKYIIEEIEPFSAVFKSRSNIVSSTKKIFVDPSLAIASLNLSFEELMNQPINFGPFFENLVMRDLLVYADSLNAKIYHYRDRNGLEADAVLKLDDGRYALIEIKVGGINAIKNAEEHLLTIKKEIIQHNTKVKDPSILQKEPSALIIITGVGESMTTKNGVHIVPIGCLKN